MGGGNAGRMDGGQALYTYGVREPTGVLPSEEGAGRLCSSGLANARGVAASAHVQHRGVVEWVVR